MTLGLLFFDSGTPVLANSFGTMHFPAGRPVGAGGWGTAPTAAAAFARGPASPYGQQTASPFGAMQSTLPVAPGTQNLNLDLTSAVRNIVLGANIFGQAPSVTIDLGGSKESFRAGSAVTAAEYVAVQQALSGGQSINLSAGGTATGGTFSLNSVVRRNVLDVVIPAGVTAIDSTSRAGIRIRGDLTNYGSIETVAGGANHPSISIMASDFTNAAGGKISSLNTPVELSLRATDTFSNAGEILGYGNVNLISGSGNFTNTGLISSARGDINFSTPDAATAITINARGGTVNAPAGNINVRTAEYAGAGNINMSGGDYLSQNLNLYAGAGTIDGNIGQVTGRLNSYAAVEHFAADTKNLILGCNTINGDPTISNTGNITISGVQTFSEDVAYLAQGNIVAGDSSAAIVSNGHNVTLIAGAELDIQSDVTVDFSTPTGGLIDFSASAAPTIIDTSSSTGKGGNVTLIAMAAGTVGGTITMPSTSKITTSSSADTAGNVLIMASAAPSVGTTTINLGTVQASGNGTSGKAGGVQILAQAPAAGQVQFHSDGKSTGTITNSGVTVKNGGINLNSVVTAGYSGAGGTASADGSYGGDGGNITIVSGGDLYADSNILSFGGGGGGGGAANANGGNGGAGGLGGAIALSTTGGNIYINGDLNTSGGGGGGGGGRMGGSAGAGGKGGSAGSITVTTYSGNATLNGKVLAASGGDGGDANAVVGNAGGGGGSYGAGGGGGAGGNGQGGGGGGGYVTVMSQFVSGGGGGSAGSGGIATGGGGGGFNGTALAPGLGGAGTVGAGADGGVFFGGSGFSFVNGGQNHGGQGGYGGYAAGQQAAPGGDRGTSPTAVNGDIKLTARQLLLQSAETTSVYGKSVQINTAVGNVVSTVYQDDADYGSAANKYVADIKVGAVDLSGGIQTTGSFTINGVTQASSLGPGSYTPGGIIITEDTFTKIVVTPGTYVSPAEYVALVQVQKDGLQRISLTGSSIGSGTAVGGQIDFNAENIPSGGFKNFNAPGMLVNVNVPTLDISGSFLSTGTVYLNAPNATLNVGKTTYIGNTMTFFGGSGAINSGDTVTAGGNVTAPNGSLSITATTGDFIVYNLLSARSISVTTSAANGNITATTGGNIITSLVASPGESKIVLTAGSNGTITTALSGVIKGAAIELNAALVYNSGRIETGTGDSVSDYYLKVSNPAGPLALNGAGKWISPTATAFYSKGDLDLAALTTVAQPLLTSNLTLSATGGDIHLVPKTITVMPTSSGDGGQIYIAARSVIAFETFNPITLQADAASTGNGGSIYLNLTNIGTLDIGPNPYNYILSARGGTTAGDGGRVYVQTPYDISANFNSISVAPQGSTGNGGTITLNAGTSITLSGGSTLAVNGVGNGSGGLIQLKAAAINYPSTGGPFTFSANGSGYGKGGNISVESNTTATVVIGPAFGNLNFTATGGNGGTALNPADGGSISFITAGSLTVNAANINVAAGGAEGAGGTISLKAGTGTLGGNLVVNGNLSASGLGNSNGGSIYLAAKSKTLFTLSTAKTTNGVSGLLNVDGAGTGKGGSISINISGDAGVKIAQALPEISGLFVSAGKGGIVIANSVGGENASMYLSVAGAGKISESGKTLITAKTLDTTSGSGSITLNNIDVSQVSANTGAKANVIITNVNTTFAIAAVTSAKGASVTIKSTYGARANNVETTNFKISTTDKGSGFIQLGNINALGTITAITDGVLDLPATSNLISQKNITLTATGATSQFFMEPTAKINTPAALSINMPKSTVFQGLKIYSGSLIEAKTVTIAAAKGNIVANGIINATTTIKITAGESIVSNGSLNGNTGVSLATATSKDPNFGGIQIKDISTGYLGGAGGAIKVVATGAQLIISPSAQILASSTKGTKASIFLQNKRASVFGQAAVDIGASANIITSGTYGGSVTIAVGTATTTTKGNTLPSVSGVTFNPGNPQKLIYLGERGVTFSGGKTQINAIGKGVKVIFNTGKADPMNITIHGGSTSSPTVITADPPIETSELTAAGAIVPNTTASVEALPVNRTISMDLKPGTNLPHSETVSANLLAAISDMQTGQFDWARRGFGQTLPAVPRQTTVGSHTSMSLNRGYRLVASGKNSTSVDTDFGNVSVSANSIVLIVAGANGTSVYNLHDNRNGSVIITIGNHKIKVVPGGHATVTAAAAADFEQVNAAESIGHRNLESRLLNKDHQVFTSEFSILQAIGSVGQLRELISSTEPETRALGNQLLKTSAIIFHLNAAKEPYKCFKTDGRLVTASAL